MEFDIFRIKRKRFSANDVIALKLFPLGKRPTRDEEELLSVLNNAIPKGKCTMNVKNDILTIDFSYDGSGGSIKFFVHDKHYLKEILENSLSLRIELKRRYSSPLCGNKPEENAMIVYLEKIDYPILFKCLFQDSISR